MPDEKKKLTRIQFGKGATPENILAAIRKMQREWAKKNPERAHQLYPNVYDEKGDVITKPSKPA